MSKLVFVNEIKDSFLHFLFPHVCEGCGSDLLNKESSLCLHCLTELPATGFAMHPGNPVEKIFWGRMNLHSAAAAYYFSKESLIQELTHKFKYKGDKELGLQLGRLLGKYLALSGRFNADALVPLPLFADKERKRGYNQATILCEGVSEVLKIPVLKNIIIRPRHTETQTRKGRLERWENIEGKFISRDEQRIQNKHLLLIDDVITTGATLEACGSELLKANNVKLSIAALCIASH
ncbi:MAG: phosphoribosyltransferase family protein [Chitinophagaceae bacterium]